MSAVTCGVAHPSGVGVAVFFNAANITRAVGQKGTGVQTGSGMLFTSRTFRG